MMYLLLRIEVPALFVSVLQALRPRSALCFPLSSRPFTVSSLASLRSHRTGGGFDGDGTLEKWEEGAPAFVRWVSGEPHWVNVHRWWMSLHIHGPFERHLWDIPLYGVLVGRAPVVLVKMVLFHRVSADFDQYTGSG